MPESTHQAEQTEIRNQNQPNLVAFLDARKELLEIEAKELSQFAIGKGVGAGLLAFGLLFFWMLLLCAGISFFGKWLGDRYEGMGWEVVAAGVALFHLLLGLIGFFKLRKRPANKFFEYSLQEIKNDRQWLKNNSKGN